MIRRFGVATRVELAAAGVGRRQLAAALRAGRLIRARRDRYVSATAPPALLEAVRVGGSLTCVSYLQLLGVFVFANSVTHIHVPRGASRLRSPHSSAQALEPQAHRGAVLHWWPLTRDQDHGSACVPALDAVVHAVRCQPARHAVATLDSAINRQVITAADLGAIFAALPAKYGVLRRLIDGRAQSGTETLVRLMVRGLGCSVDLQVEFAGVGFVDLVVDGWLVVECDSKEFHSSWQQQVKDRDRDMKLASRGYTSVRFTAAQILHEPESVLAALRGLIRARRPGRFHRGSPLPMREGVS